MSNHLRATRRHHPHVGRDEYTLQKARHPYAWEKYAQVIAHDFVSGSMENTGATLHGEFMEQHERELLDDNQEEFISHELFHQWFGDLVTCESWSNLPLNESFASYGEYLWNEHKYGRDEADYYLQNDLATYLRESKSKQVNMVRFFYENRDDMFDRHSYEKGECILHMLRKYLGDEAFFSSLKLYLENNKFKAVEIHQVRLAFEEVSGEDLNWFFNQWFLNSGHPELDITYQWNEELKVETVTIKQLQNLSKTPLYKLPIDIDIYNNGVAERHRVIVDKENQSFAFSCLAKPDLVNTDGEKMLLCTKKDHHTEEEWISLYKRGKSFIDRKEALQFLSKDMKTESEGATLVISALEDPFWGIRLLATNNIKPLSESKDKEKIRQKLIFILNNDKEVVVRNNALKLLIKDYASEGDSSLIRNAINDKSYTVSLQALKEFTKNNKEEGLQLAKSMEDFNVKLLREKLASLYSEFGNDQQSVFMKECIQRANGFSRYTAVSTYAKFLKRCNDLQVIKSGLSNINDQVLKDDSWFIRMAAVQALNELGNYYKEKSITNPSFASLKEVTDQYLNNIKLNDKDEHIRNYINKSQ